MRNVDGHNPYLDVDLVQSPKTVPKKDSQLHSKEIEFLDSIKLYGITECIRSLKTVHDLALYHTTELCLSSTDIYSLYCLKMLWEGLEEVKRD